MGIENTCTAQASLFLNSIFISGASVNGYLHDKNACSHASHTASVSKSTQRVKTLSKACSNK